MRALLLRPASFLAVVSLCSAVGLPAFAADPKIEEAKKHMAAGAALYNDPSGHKCAEAIGEFKSAFELSGSLKALKGVGVCAQALELDGDAIDAYEKVLAGNAKLDAADKKQLQSDLAALKAGVAKVTLKSDRGDVRVTDARSRASGSPVTNRYTIGAIATTLGVHPGSHVFTASVDGEPDQTFTVDAQNGGTYEQSFTFAKKEPAPVAAAEPPKKVVAPAPPSDASSSSNASSASLYVAGGITLASAAATGVMMVVAKNKKATYDADNGHTARIDLEAERSAVQSANVLSDVLLGVTVGSAVATTVLYLRRPNTTEPASAWTVAPAVGLHSGGALVGGSF